MISFCTNNHEDKPTDYKMYLLILFTEGTYIQEDWIEKSTHRI
jgi:hypothetical protein